MSAFNLTLPSQLTGSEIAGYPFTPSIVPSSENYGAFNLQTTPIFSSGLLFDNPVLPMKTGTVGITNDETLVLLYLGGLAFAFYVAIKGLK